MKRLIALLLLFAAVFAVSCSGNDVIEVVKDTKEKVTALIKGSEKLTQKIDYADEKNWFAYAAEPTKAVDVIYFIPCAYEAPEGGNELCSANEPSLREAAPGYLRTQAAVFEEDCNVYAPVYRQYDFSFLAALPREDRELSYEFAASVDAFAAMDRYFEAVNKGRPYILAGHGQGSDMVRMILGKYMKEHPEEYKRMVAAYVIGSAVTRPFMSDYPHLKFASGEADTGVIVSYNTEGQGNYSFVNDFVIDRRQTLVINPLSWNSEKVSVPASSNLGTLTEDGEIVPGLIGAHINKDRGTVVCDNDELSKYAYSGDNVKYFGRQSYHFHDYDFFFMNLRANAKKRIEAYFASKAA